MRDIAKDRLSLITQENKYIRKTEGYTIDLVWRLGSSQI